MPNVEWSWSSRVGATAYRSAVTLTDAEVIIAQESTASRERRCSIADAFARPFRFFEAPRDLCAFVAEMAARLREADVRSTRDAARLRFWRAFEPSRLRAEAFSWSIERPTEAPLARTMRLEEIGAFLDVGPHVRPRHDLPDELFVDGPPGLMLPADAREAVRARLFEALRPGHGLVDADSFPRLDHSRIACRTWSFAARPDGDSGVSTQPGMVVAGTYYAHDYGYDEYEPERVLSRSPRVSLGAPAEVEREVLEVLEAARA